MTTAGCCWSSRRRSRLFTPTSCPIAVATSSSCSPCSGCIAASVAVITTKETKLGLDLQGGVQLVYEGKPTKQQPTVTAEGLDRALDIMRDRVDSLGVAEPELQRSGENQIDVEPPGRGQRRARRAPGRHHGPDVLLRLGTEHPGRGLQDQPGAGQRRPAADQRALQRGQAGLEVPRRSSTTTTRRPGSGTRSTRTPTSRSTTASRRRTRPTSRRTWPHRTSRTRRSSRCPRASSSCAPSTSATPRTSAARSTSGG